MPDVSSGDLRANRVFASPSISVSITVEIHGLIHYMVSYILYSLREGFLPFKKYNLKTVKNEKIIKKF
jgi:hypothetical protein